MNIQIKEFKQIKNKNIIVDTNLLIYCGDKQIADQAKGFLRILKDQDNKLAFSEISRYEIMRSGPDSNLLYYYQKLLDYIDGETIDHVVLNNSWVLYRVFQKKSSLKNNNKRPSDADFLVAGTAVTHNALILTANRKDFHGFIWKTFAKGYVIKEEKDSFRCISVYLLGFNESCLNVLQQEAKPISSVS